MSKLFIFFLSVIFFLLPTGVNAAMWQVKITEDGFEPSNLQITKFDQVEFINQSEELSQPASDPHPTHHFFKQFDPRIPIALKNSWTFTFDKPGIFRYHDHLHPHKKGIISVSENPDAKIEATRSNIPDITPVSKKVDFLEMIKTYFFNTWQKIEESLQNLFPNKEGQNIKIVEFKELDEQKQQEYLKKLISEKGSKLAWEYLKEEFKDEAGFSGNIHDLAHFTGGLIYQKDQFSGLSNCTSEFSFGCFHGFLDMAFKNDLSKIDQAVLGCSALGATGPYSSCIHGIGHGVASFYRIEDLTSALKTCEQIINGAEFCFDGVFMEFSRNAPKSYYKVDDYLYPCNYIDKKYISACGRNQPSVLLDRFELKLSQVADLCLKFENEQFGNSCVDSIGFIAASRSFGNPNNIINDCQSFEENSYFTRCVYKAAGELVFQNYPNWQQISYSVCKLLSDEANLECQNYLETIKKDFNRS